MLKNKIQDEVITALKNHDAVTVSVLRFITAKIQNQEIDKKQSLDDDEVIQIIKKEIQHLDEAIVLAQKGGRDDLVAENQKQRDILTKYLPQASA